MYTNSSPEVEIAKLGKNIVQLQFTVDSAHLNQSILTKLRQLEDKLRKQAELVSLWLPIEVQLTKTLELKVQRLRKRLLNLQAEIVESKKKRWCCLCEEEATLMSGTSFYCSERCRYIINKMKNNK